MIYAKQINPHQSKIRCTFVYEFREDIAIIIPSRWTLSCILRRCDPFLALTDVQNWRWYRTFFCHLSNHEALSEWSVQAFCPTWSQDLRANIIPSLVDNACTKKNFLCSTFGRNTPSRWGNSLRRPSIAFLADDIHIDLNCLAGMLYMFGGDILFHIRSTLSDRTASPLDVKDKTDFAKLIPLIEVNSLQKPAIFH